MTELKLLGDDQCVIEIQWQAPGLATIRIHEGNDQRTALPLQVALYDPVPSTYFDLTQYTCTGGGASQMVFVHQRCKRACK